MTAVRFSRGLCAFLSFTSLLGAPAFVNVVTDETAPFFIATMISSAVGFMLFDREYKRLRRDARGE